jgi:Ser/Thr protein kinase RdoA (MazF antagonist)
MTYSTLSDDALVTALDAWHLGRQVAIQRLPGGFTSDVWRVDTPRQRLIAKYAYDRREAFERGLLAAEILERHGISSGGPIRTTAGDLTVMLDGPHRRSQPLALLCFVPGIELDWSAAQTPQIVGQLLGRVHAVLHREYPRPANAGELFAYVTEQSPEVAAQPGLQRLIDRAVAAVRSFEARIPVTYGGMYGDYMEFICDSTTNQVGLIDWGAFDWGPLLFDLAIVDEEFRGAGGAAEVQIQQFYSAYLAESPVTAQEVAGVTAYTALHTAQIAKYFAWRLAHNVTRGDDDPDGNARSLAEIRTELEQLLATLE